MSGLGRRGRRAHSPSPRAEASAMKLRCFLAACARTIAATVTMVTGGPRSPRRCGNSALGPLAGACFPGRLGQERSSASGTRRHRYHATPHMDARISAKPDAIGATSTTGHVADLPDTPTVGSPRRQPSDEWNPSLVCPRAFGLEHRRCRFAYGALRHFAKRISALPRIRETTGGANEVSARWNHRLLRTGPTNCLSGFSCDRRPPTGSNRSLPESLWGRCTRMEW